MNSSKFFVEFPHGYKPQIDSSIKEPGTRIIENRYIISNLSILSSYNQDYYATPCYETSDGGALFYPKEIVLKFKDNISVADQNAFTATYNLNLVKQTSSYTLYNFSDTQDALRISKSIYESNFVEFCTPNFLIEAIKTEYIPNDPYFGQQWYLNNTGQGTNDGKTTTVDADIDAPEAWEITKGSSNIIIAVIDEGVTSNHPDLPNSRQVRLNGSNFAYQYDGTNNPNNPSPTVSTVNGNNHGNACAGIIAATQDNNLGITGIAPLCKIMPIKIPVDNASASIFADAITFAVNNNADIISNSWGFVGNQPVITSSINYAISNEKFVVFAAGNSANRINGSVGGALYPANNQSTPKLIAVAASDRNNQVANYSPNSTYMKIAAPSNSAFDNEIPSEAENIWTIDIPGINYGMNSWKNATSGLPNLGETLPNNTNANYSDYTGRMGGTSAAAPQVAAVLALMKSINTCLSYDEIISVLYDSAEKIGGYNYNWSNTYEGRSKELGYGKLNAYRAVLKTQMLNSNALDLIVRDGIDDMGFEPNNTTQELWTSPDIWVRNVNDNGGQHQNPEYHPTAPNYIYVRITNNSCLPSTGNEKISVYRAKASTYLGWDYSWIGNNFPNGGPKRGNLVGGTAIPVIQPHASTVVSIPWLVPNPADYTGLTTDDWHFCLLARMDNVTDPMTFTETSDIITNVKNNNNIGWKNLTVVDVLPNSRIGGSVAVENLLSTPKTYTLNFYADKLETGKKIFEEAEVSLAMDDVLYNAWLSGGKVMNNLKATTDVKKLIVTGDNAMLGNLNYPANKTGILNLSFNFLTEEVTDKSLYTYHVVQKDANSVIGGETYEVTKEQRELFYANSGENIAVDKNETVTLSAQQINEPAIYNWYDSDENLIYEGANITISAEIAEKYKLEIISLSDGYKDYDEVEVTLNPNTLESISPNPASSEVAVAYKINNGGSAYVCITNFYYPIISYNYILDITESEIDFDLTAYGQGTYLVTLICDSQVVDTKIMIKK